MKDLKKEKIAIKPESQEVITLEQAREMINKLK